MPPCLHETERTKLIHRGCGPAIRRPRRSSGSKDVDAGLSGRVALVTGGNHGIGAATAEALADAGAAVFVTYLRLAPPAGLDHLGDGGARRRYAENQARSADAVVAAVRAAGGRADGVEADLADPATPAHLFDRAEATFGPVEVLINNAAHGAADSFLPADHRTGLAAGGDTLRPFTAEGYDRHVAVNDRAAGLMMAEFARRHAARGRRGAASSTSARTVRRCFPVRCPTGPRSTPSRA